MHAVSAIARVRVKRLAAAQSARADACLPGAAACPAALRWLEPGGPSVIHETEELSSGRAPIPSDGHSGGANCFAALSSKPCAGKFGSDWFCS